ncbi:hypothetical protein [Idiomarina aminovorans]|uniref:hypothetical protein n=1 Tax=Idiomarina aminovorans TaxID=2914829 RepID=UPI00200515FF|nr:hypothetical protein [Idiomarina sp. ATCH4]MCK7460205.1 hypothetical protein [Idiomarina sp. ATCH4]
MNHAISTRITALALISSCFSASALSSDVLVSADFNVGQGFNYLIDNNCYVVTPKHVMGDAQSANIMLPTRQYQTAELEHFFAVDIALLKATTSAAQCNTNSFLQISDLQKLLQVYQEGVLKTRLADGSVLQTKVVINAVDDSEFLAIKPERNDETLKQGYSGSILFVAEQAAGVLLEVDDEGGIVYRADALTTALHDYFDLSVPDTSASEPTDTAAANDDETTTNSHLTGRLATNQIKDYRIQMLGNSPVEFIIKHTESDSMRFAIQILDKRENELLDHKFWNTNDYKFAFTPPNDDEFIVRIRGLQDFGEFDIKMNDYAFDAELRGAGNQITVPGQIAPKIALNAVSEYRLNGEQNSPIEFTLHEIAADEFRYSIRIIDSAGTTLQNYNFWSDRDYNYTFTPLSSGEYLVRVVGLQHYGQTQININQWTTNAELLSRQNVVSTGDLVSAKLAEDAVAEYRMMMTANAPIDFKLDAVAPEMRFRLEIFDETGDKKYSEEFWTSRNNRFVFTPLSSDVHLIRLTGLQNHGTFNFKLFGYD